MAHFEYISEKIDPSRYILPDDIVILIIQLFNPCPKGLGKLIILSKHCRELVYANIVPFGAFLCGPYQPSETYVEMITMKLIKHNSLKMLKLFARNNTIYPTDIYCFDENKRKEKRKLCDTPVGLLGAAVFYEKIEILRFFLTDAKYVSYVPGAIKEASRICNVKIFKLLYPIMSVEQKSNWYFTYGILEAAVSSGCVTILKILLNDQQFRTDHVFHIMNLVYKCKSVECIEELVKSGRFDTRKIIKYSFYIVENLDQRKHLDFIYNIFNDQYIKIFNYAIHASHGGLVGKYAKIYPKTIGECFYDLVLYKYNKIIKNRSLHRIGFEKYRFSCIDFSVFGHSEFDPSAYDFKLLKTILSDEAYSEIFFNDLSAWEVMKKFCAKTDKKSLEYALHLYDIFCKKVCSNNMVMNEYVDVIRKTYKCFL
jgi:hypothetical protein